MCYNVYLATTCEEQPVSLDPKRYSFKSEARDDSHESCLTLLKLPHIWYLSSFGGCSCHFRHIIGEFSIGSSSVLPAEFSAPVDWTPEDADHIEVTANVYDVLSSLVGGGHQVEVINFWAGAGAEDIKTIEVSLGNVPRDHFRFFENYRFVLRP